MSSYEPGTVAVATVRGVPNVRVFLSDPNDSMEWTSAGMVEGNLWHRGRDLSDVRPLVVLDLSASDTLALIGDLRRFVGTPLSEAVADQIEAQKKPPRIPQPGLWGVVEATVVGDRMTRAFVRHDAGSASTLRPWLSDNGRWHEWDDLIDPTLIRDGIEDGAK